MEARGVRNHNPLNIRKGDKWQGLDNNGTDTEFCTFINDAYGFRAAFRILKNYMRATPRHDTIRKIITRWAPPADNNDTEAYISTVSKLTGISPDSKIQFSEVGRMIDLVKAMAKVETGHDYNERVILTGYQLETPSR